MSCLENDNEDEKYEDDESYHDCGAYFKVLARDDSYMTPRTHCFLSHP